MAPLNAIQAESIQRGSRLEKLGDGIEKGGTRQERAEKEGNTSRTCEDGIDYGRWTIWLVVFDLQPEKNVIRSPFPRSRHHRHACREWTPR
jgi:hypothetical protein